MAYVLFTPPTRNAGMVRKTSPAGKRAIGRIVQPLKVGQSLLRTGGEWRLVNTPTTDETKAVDIHTDGTVLYFAGGHQHLVRSDLVDEMIAQGIDIDADVTLVPAYPSLHPGCYPTPQAEEEPPPAPGFDGFPDDDLLPADTLYPGAT